MLIIYDKATGAVVHNTGVRSFADPTPEQWFTDVLQQRAPERPITDYGFHPIDDRDLAEQIIHAGSYELQFTAGQPSGVTIYPRLQAPALITAAANADVEIIATVPAGSPDANATFTLDGNAEAEPITAGAAAHLYRFAYAGRYLVVVESAHHGGANVEVVVS